MRRKEIGLEKVEGKNEARHLPGGRDLHPTLHRALQATAKLAANVQLGATDERQLPLTF